MVIKDPLLIRLEKVIEEYNQMVEAGLTLLIKPKPKWLPQRLWIWLLKKLITLKHFPRGDK